MKTIYFKGWVVGLILSGVCTVILLGGCSGQSTNGSSTAQPTTRSQNQPATQNMTGTNTKVTTSATGSASGKPLASITQNVPVALVSLAIAEKKVKAGDNFKVEVIVNTEAPLRGAQCALDFDPSLMKCHKVEEGSFLAEFAESKGMSTIVMPQAKIDNDAGKISDIGIFMAGRVPEGATGKGVLVVYHFTALKDGVAEPRLSKVKLGGIGSKDAALEIPVKIIP